jgi:protein-tyrosine-phosphatase
MAEAVLIHEAGKRAGLKLTVDSAGTGAYHTGEPPDVRYVGDKECESERLTW